MSTAGTTFYVTGGTMRVDAPSYVERQADHDLLEGLLHGEFCYVLTSRQMGKSSLMVRTAQKLRARGVHVTVLDLTAVGQNLSPEQWYDGLLSRMGRQLGLEDELEDFWRANTNLGAIQRFMAGIHDVVLAKRAGPMVIFVDEIDSVRSLKFSTDEFFAAIRESHNRRTQDPELNRLTFCLLGVATPSDLIRDIRTTPFNIGRRVELTDFTETEAQPLLPGLRYGRDAVEDMTEPESRIVLRRILHWTGGHPYLTQRMCRAVADKNDATEDMKSKLHDAKGIDRLCEELFLCQRARERDDNLLFVRERILRSEAEVPALLDLYLKVWSDQRVPDDETNPLVTVLRLSGIARAAQFLEVRNPIYRRVFDRAWIMANTPEAERIRQREAFRRGLYRGLAFAVVFLLLSAGLSAYVKGRVESHRARRAVERLGSVYHGLRTYSDMGEFKNDYVMKQGARVTMTGRAWLTLEKPDKLNVRITTYAAFAEYTISIVRNGSRTWIYAPRSKLYFVLDKGGSLRDTIDIARSLTGMPLNRTLYGIIAEADPEAAMAKRTRRARFSRLEEFDGTNTVVLDLPSMEETKNLDTRVARSGPKRAPATVWLGAKDGLVRQLEVNLSDVERSVTMPGRTTAEVPVQEFIATSHHTDILVNQPLKADRFIFTPPPDAQEVDQDQFEVSLTMANGSAEQPAKITREELAGLIPPRLANTPARLVDLERYYNAPLTRAWHSNNEGNDLAMLPRGIQMIDGSPFDVRGLVQLAGTAQPYLASLFPRQVADIKVGQKARALHFFHGTAWPAAVEGAQVGRYVIHYVDGRRRVAPINYGYDVLNWWAQGEEPSGDTGIREAWSGSNKATVKVRLFHTAWQNPLPDVAIQSVDFVSSMTASAPFLVALTVEP